MQEDAFDSSPHSQSQRANEQVGSSGPEGKISIVMYEWMKEEETTQPKIRHF